MNSNELFEQFKSSTKGYQLTPVGIVFEKEKGMLKVYKPLEPETKHYLLYDLIIEGKMSSSTDDIDELIELSTEVMGETTRKSDELSTAKSNEESTEYKNPYQYY